jgi:plasmid stability protein
MEEEIRQILRNAVSGDNPPVTKLGSRIAARFAKIGITTESPELRGQHPRLAQFDG